MVQKTIVFLIVLFTGQLTVAQAFEPTIEIGPTVGSSFYLGDANGTWFRNDKPAWGGVIRFPLNTRVAISFEGLRSSITGQYINQSNKTEQSFKNSYFFSSAHIEFNFFSYDRYNLTLESSTIDPYILGGVGIVSYSYQSATSVLTGGLGVKFKLNSRWDLNCQWTMNKTFADDFEGVAPLNNPYTLNKSLFLNNDYFSVLSVSLTFAFYTKRCSCRTGLLKGF
ncbi:DUF6089 family protein [Microbacter margulisiae]|uniref:DUF6089 domain-containing protein n=1 Tax=Microbacter margulisiae TaxID=1350067 RepID=A0A7W5DPR6_9PORP|nr:DUF6089 family protein [Microbacter margulisiae]MBB3186706.1 hypothetical protein [Microbacter margulisiae]